MVSELRAAAAASVTVPLDAGLDRRVSWRKRYVLRVLASDVVVVALAVACAHLGTRAPSVDEFDTATLFDDRQRVLFSLAVAVLWPIFLTWCGTRTPQAMASGFVEYRGLIVGTLCLFGLLAAAAVLFGLDGARDYLLVALPIGLIGLLMSRMVWRRFAFGPARAGCYQRSVLMVGGTAATTALCAALGRNPRSGYRVVGTCGPSTDGMPDDRRAVIQAARRCGADTVVLAGTERFTPQEIRRMAWDLEALGAELIVTPGITDVAATRVTTQLIAGIPMLHIGKPRYDRAESFRKGVFDLTFAATVIVVLAPVLLAVAAAVKFTSHGPVFYRSERIGMDGKPFHMIKFRSMYTDADKQIAALIATNGGNPLFFKMKDDPRVTPVGRFLRRYSLDELPQFFNVLRREMSVVGPRPQVRREVRTYDGTTRRRLWVKPGVTGLWQVSGRSDLSPEDSVRLDLCYVENWSMLLDLGIIVRTLRAVTAADGAY